MGSKPFELTVDDIVKVLRGSLIAGGGAALSVITTWVTGTDFGMWTSLIGAGWAIVLNFLRKFLTDNSEPVTYIGK